MQPLVEPGSTRWPKASERRERMMRKGGSSAALARAGADRLASSASSPMLMGLADEVVAAAAGHLGPAVGSGSRLPSAAPSGRSGQQHGITASQGTGVADIAAVPPDDSAAEFFAASKANKNCVPSALTRKVQCKRLPHGGFSSDAPAWKLEAGTQPIVPSFHRMLSRQSWGSINQNYKEYPENSEMDAGFVDYRGSGDVIKQFCQPKDDFNHFAREMFKVGNQQIMRKGGSSMKKAGK
eukprot:TRINITY_DN101977_c0_g1_i1.p1 TRINITY_DN101977_c0_g1~~TRINITY_DN101977_c0_g1_i1.p1  ORF type:complete len:239 (+),score=63.58 TRINITY_DN101977_c0_g1_i1:99-815(+)